MSRVDEKMVKRSTLERLDSERRGLPTSYLYNGRPELHKHTRELRLRRKLKRSDHLNDVDKSYIE